MSTAAPSPGSGPSWFARHPLLTVVGVLLLIGWVLDMGEGDDDQGSSASSAVASSDAPAEDQAAEQSEEEEESEQPRSEETQKPTEEPIEAGSGKRAGRTDKSKEPNEQPNRKPVPGALTLWPVLRVIDGDTVEVAYKGRAESIRIIGIDTPETVHPSEPVECWGPQASTAAAQALEGRKVALSFDPSQGRRDYYDRLLAYLSMPGLGDFGLHMITTGNAAEYTYDGAYAHQASYQAAEAQARGNNRGLWGKCGGVDKPLKAPGPSPTKKKKPPAGGGGGGGGGNCASGYSPCLPPYPPDVNCEDVDGPIRVTGDDPHGLDADGDGVACES